ncbi:double-strand break repair protein MRE11, partial [Tremellales sp. Uapishka_1]
MCPSDNCALEGVHPGRQTRLRELIFHDVIERSLLDQVELLSDPMDGSTPGYSFPAVNYEDPNLNVGIPVFSIHGNHDDPQGTGPASHFSRSDSLLRTDRTIPQEGALCALDILSVSGVLNYFGKLDLTSDEALPQNEEKGIKIKPILLKKGTSHLAMYGVGNVKDARMHYELRANRVKMFMPEAGEVKEDDWFNMLLVHQNRVKHGPQQSVPEGMFDDSIKLVVWGHEHDCRITPEMVSGKDYYITQPGSSVATSLAPGEAIPKHVGILSIQGSQFQIAEIPLKTVRPFELDEVVLAEVAEEGQDGVDLEDKDSITKYLRTRVEELIGKAELKWAECHEEGDEEMMLPLIRLKVETSDAKEMTNPVRFGQDFIGRVANPRDILQYYRKKKVGERKTKNLPDQPDGEELDDEEWNEADPAAMTANDRLSKLRMASLVSQYLKAQNLEVLVENGLEDAVLRFVEKDDKDAIKDFVAETLKNVGRDMRNREMDEDNVEEEMAASKLTYGSQWDHAHPDGPGGASGRPAKKAAGKGKSKGKDSDEDSMAAEDSMMEVDSDASLASSARPKGKSKAAAAKSKKAPLFQPSESEEEEEEEIVPAKKSRAPAKKAPAKAPKAPAKTPAKRGAASKAAPSRQSQLPWVETLPQICDAQSNYHNASFTKGKASKPIELSDDE